MKSIITKLFTVVLLFTTSAICAQTYKLDGQLSSVNFATIKKQYVVEPATITDLSGQLSSSGAFSINLPLSAIDTGVPIRNQRLASIYFAAAQYPQVTVAGQFDMKKIAAKQAVFNTSVDAKVTLFGKTQTLSFPVTVLKAKNTIMVSSSKPVIVNGEAFGIPAANLKALAATVGNIPLSAKVPVTLNLVFQK